MGREKDSIKIRGRGLDVSPAQSEEKSNQSFYSSRKEYFKNYYTKNKELINEKAKRRFKNLTQEQLERINLRRRERRIKDKSD